MRMLYQFRSVFSWFFLGLISIRVNIHFYRNKSYLRLVPFYRYQYFLQFFFVRYFQVDIIDLTVNRSMLSFIFILIYFFFFYFFGILFICSIYFYLQIEYSYLHLHFVSQICASMRLSSFISFVKFSHRFHSIHSIYVLSYLFFKSIWLVFLVVVVAVVVIATITEKIQCLFCRILCV